MTLLCAGQQQGSSEPLTNASEPGVELPGLHRGRQPHPDLFISNAPEVGCSLVHEHVSHMSTP